jgi:RHS repeat-associated protein
MLGGREHGFEHGFAKSGALVSQPVGKTQTWSDRPYPGSPVFSSETRYVHDGMLIIQERNSSNVPLVSYTRGTDLSGTFEGAGGIGGLLARSHGYSSGSWTNHNFYHADGNGNVTAMVGGNQSLVASYRYDPYGRTTYSSGTLASANVYRFSSKPIHANSGLYYYGYRFYWPELQRWMSRDPLGELGSRNLYGFYRNSPLQHVDPYGLVVDDPPDCLGFTFDDVERAVIFAGGCGILGPDNMSIIQMWKEMKVEFKEKVKWWKSQEKVPSTHALTDAACNVTIHFPKCNPYSMKKDIPGEDGQMFYFRAAILHELVHAYGRMQGKGAFVEDAVRVGNQVNACIEQKVKEAAKGAEKERTK